MNHWTGEQDKRQLEMWADRHPFISGCVTLLVLPIYGLMIVVGIGFYLFRIAWEALPYWVKSFFTFITLGTAILFTLYWMVYGGLWALGRCLAPGV